MVKSAHSLRVGTEWRSGSWYFRGGWAYQPDPYNDKDARHGTAYKQYSGGIGYRTTHYSIDLAKMRALGWQPRHSPQDAIRKTVQWYVENRWWWEPIKSGEFRAYYEKMYGHRLADAHSS